MNPQLSLYLLRGFDPQRVGAIARGGGPSREGDRFHLYCPVCGCRKTGVLDEPNGHDECCTAEACLCHAEELALCSSCDVLFSIDSDQPWGISSIGNAPLFQHACGGLGRQVAP